MQNGIVDNSISPERVFVGALEGRSCCSGLEDLEVSPKLIINFYLSGGQSFVIDGVHFSESAEVGSPRVSMINVRHESRIHFNHVDAGRLRKVKLSIPLNWIEREIGAISTCSPVLRRFLSTHLSHFAFEPTPDLVELAEQISRPPPNLKGELLTLYRTARGIELMRLSCALLVAQAEEIDHKPSLMSARQSERVRNFILANLSKTLTIETIARESGASVSSVQRHFKQQFGITVFEFIRRKRLEAARDALEVRGVTVAEAAWIAGYTSPSGFITAFKKTYGTCPGDIRA
ncbi:AraC family transcriptional regulator [Hyphomicrobium sp.]|uniref:helix-turn-helix domain-containing protein n=1 Tax=Hyphomicrobium sp. TaxID=82 RepID=UPI0025C4491C|nr:AraC family transcriptional regulator [Hyphomicrobium sp.]MCC7250491.1 helix-turn-helix transcriptional regulator [Hyphomicrobium sp.]